MTDEPTSKPPLPRAEMVDVTGDDDDEVFEPPPPPLPRRRIPMPPKAPPEPFRKLIGAESREIELAALLKTTHETLDGVVVSTAQTLATQRKLALQLDGFQRAINDRLDVFHRELAMLRATVTGDHAPRIGAVEQRAEETAAKVELTMAERARRMTLAGGRYTVAATAAGLIARAIAKGNPEFADTIDTWLGFFGL